MPTNTFISNTGDGYINYDNVTWATCRGAATGDSVSTSDTVVRSPEAGWTGSTYRIRRSFFWWDLSSLSSSISITSATVRFVFNNGEWFDDDETKTDLVLSTAETSLTTADFDALNTTLMSDDRADLDDINSGSPLTFTYTLNAAGISALQSALGGTFKLALRNSRDRLNQTPTGKNQHGTAYANNGTAGNKPLLTIVSLDSGNTVFFNGGGLAYA